MLQQNIKRESDISADQAAKGITEKRTANPPPLLSRHDQREMALLGTRASIKRIRIWQHHIANLVALNQKIEKSV